MKNIKYLLLLLIVVPVLFFAGCKEKENVDSNYSIEELEEYVINSVHAYKGTGDMEEYYYINVANNVTLPTSNPDKKGTKITWTSYDISRMTDSGEIVERDKRTVDVEFSCFLEYGKKTKDLQFIIKLTSIDLETAATRFKAQLPSIIFEDRTFTTVYDKVIEVSWTSSNEEAFSNEGKYTKLDEDSETIITFILRDSNSSYEDNVTIPVRGKTMLDLYAECEEWVKTEVVKETYLDENITLPSAYLNKVNLTWTSSNKDVIENDGTIHRTIYDRYAYLTCKIDAGSSFKTFKFQIKVLAKDITAMSNNDIIEEFVETITPSTTEKRYFLLYTDINQYYGFIPFYLNNALPITEQIAPLSGDNRPGTIKRSTQYITVHDTANNATTANAQMHANYVTNGGGGTSWHYSVDENGAFHQIPDNEVAYHAGDGSRQFDLVDTNIKATSRMPHVYLEDGYYYILGQNTNLKPYDNTEATRFVTEKYTDEDINELGVFLTIGSNGNYFLGRTYFNSDYDQIANFGGNRNSIGIESCVNKGSDYGHTFRMLARLVAKLCIENNLSVDRVKGHRFFSGKPCPNSILTSNYWADLLTLVSMEKFASENFGAYKFKWEATSANIDNSGFISKNVKAGDKLTYKVTISNASSTATVYTKSFETIVG